MHRSRTQLDAYNRNLSVHKPGAIPRSSRQVSPISANQHKYELKQRIWPKHTVESWFANHSSDDRRAVYSFLNTLYDNDGNERQNRSPSPLESAEPRRRSPRTRLPSRTKTAMAPSSGQSLHRRLSNSGNGGSSRASKRDLGEILSSLESFRPSSSSSPEKGIQTTITPVTLPNVNGKKINNPNDSNLKRSTTSSGEKYTETIQPLKSNDETTNGSMDDGNKISAPRYLSHTWRVINPREDPETNVRPENNASSFFSYTKKVYPEYFFIHPDWY